MRSINRISILVYALAGVALAMDTARDRYTIGFASLGPGRLNIFLANGEGENAKPLLTKSDVDYNPSFSADGAWIVFTSQRGGSADIYRVHPNGSGMERLTDNPAFDDQGVLSPNGKTLAFVSTRAGPANIWMLDLPSRKLKDLTPDSSGDFRPAWSPDGEWITFSSDRDTKPLKNNFSVVHATEIYVMRRDGSNIRRITTSDGATVGSPSWSPDGSRIVFSLVASAELFKITLPARSHGDMQIVSVDLKTGERSVLTKGPD
jgi:TolB protein